MRLNEADLSAVGRLTYDATALPAYEMIKSCLVWPDEVAAGISSDGYEFLCDLWAVRGLMHRKVPFDQWPLNPKAHQAVWEAGLLEIPEWPGFKRLQLSEADEQYLQHCLAQDAAEDF